MAKDMVAGRLKSIFDTMQTDRRQTENLWRDMSFLVDPSRSTEEFEQRGRDRSGSTYDNTASVASMRLASLLFGNLVNPSLEWFSLQSLNGVQTRDSMEWMQHAQEQLLTIFRSPNSGFNSAIIECFSDLATFGTCAMMISGQDQIRFNALFLDELYFATDHFGRIDTVFRRKFYTADQAGTKFGPENLSDSVKKTLASNRRYQERREYVHTVMPRQDVEMDDQLPIASRFPFVSVWIDSQEGVVVHEGGFDSFPYAVGRWRVASGETYGVSPGIEVADEIRLANAMKKAIIVAGSKASNLPLQVEDDAVIGSVRVLPGGITYVRPGKEIKQLPVGDPNVSDKQLEDVREFIREAYFNDLDRLPDNDRMTATEIVQRRQDRLIQMSPSTTRVESEVLGSCIERSLKLAIQKGAVDQPPDELRGGNVKIEYVSPLKISQKSSRVQAFKIWVNEMLPIAQFDPSIFMSIKTEAVAGFLADALNVPLELVRDIEEVQQLKEQANRTAQLQAEAQAGGEIAQTAKTAAEAAEIAGSIGVA